MFAAAVVWSSECFFHKSLEAEQTECIRRIVCRKEDVLAVLPTGFGKSVIYQLIPNVLVGMNRATSTDAKTSVVVVSPLEYIKKQQVENLRTANCGISAATIGESIEMDREIANGKFDIVYGSAEQWLIESWRKTLQCGNLHRAEVLVGDEVHTVATW